MRKKCLKIFSILALCFCLIFVSNVYASTMTISGAASGSPGTKVTITVGGDFTGRVNLTVSNGTLSASSVWIEENSQSVTVTLGASGTTTVTATGAAGTSDASGNIVSVGSKSKSITINQPTTNNNTTTTKPSTGTPTTKPSNNTTTTKPTTNTNTNTNKNTTTTKSSNANLKNVILGVEGLTPAFSKDITTYSLKVGENVNTIKVTASVEHSRASYSVSGNTNLKEGENVITVKVTAENGTTKTYTINVLKSDDPVKSDATLSSLIIEDVNLGQTFDSNITEYNAGDITVKDSKLNIYAYPNNENATLEIIGNEDLKIGEGKVTIRVTSENGKIIKDYIVSFNKLYSNENNKEERNALVNEEEKTSFGEKIKLFYNNTLKENMVVIILYLFIWIEFIQVVYLYERLKKYEDVDKITVGKIVKTERIKKVKKEKVEKPRRVKENPIFPDDEDEK